MNKIILFDVLCSHVNINEVKKKFNLYIYTRGEQNLPAFNNVNKNNVILPYILLFIYYHII